LLKIIRDGNITDAQAQPSMQGLPITREWLYSSQAFRMQSSAKCILVVEKEGIYNRLVEDRIFDRFPCILVTGKGFPDLATRALVSSLHRYFALPVYGICDCNPYGVSVLSTFQKGGKKKSLDRDDSYGVPIMWLGLKPSVVQKLQIEKRLPLDVFQQMTEFDRKRLRSLCVESHHLKSRLQELEIMRQLNYKVELEALHWLGMNYICDWLEDVLRRHDLGETGLII
jgi:meiotic recombination protein SPO11